MHVVDRSKASQTIETHPKIPCCRGHGELQLDGEAYGVLVEDLWESRIEVRDEKEAGIIDGAHINQHQRAEPRGLFADQCVVS